VAKGEGCYPRLHHVRSSAEEEHDLEALVHSCENGEVLRPIVGCNDHSCYSVFYQLLWRSCIVNWILHSWKWNKCRL